MNDKDGGALINLMVYTLEEELERQKRINTGLALELVDLKERYEREIDNAFYKGKQQGEQEKRLEQARLFGVLYAILGAIKDYLWVVRKYGLMTMAEETRSVRTAAFLRTIITVCKSADIDID